jgi:hypothetical protein
MAVLDSAERAAIEQADSDISDLQRAFEAAARSGAVDEASVERLSRTAQEVMARISSSLPPHLDSDAASEIRKRLIEMATRRDDEGLLDMADRALIEAEAVRHIFRDMLQEQPAADFRDAGAIVRLLEQWLPDLSVGQLAELFDVSVRQLQRRRKEGGASTRRMQIVARLVALLRGGWTDEGVYAWFYRPRRELGGKAPIEVIDDPSCERDLILMAKAGRVQGGV